MNLYLCFGGVENLFFKVVGNCDFSLPTRLDNKVINSRSIKKVSVSFIKCYFWRKQIIWTIHYTWSLVSIYDLHSSHYPVLNGWPLWLLWEILLQQLSPTSWAWHYFFLLVFFSILISKYRALSDEFYILISYFVCFYGLEKIFTIKIKFYND